MKCYTLECCVDSVESAICAQEGGATRLELCSNLVIGGTSPSIKLYEEVRKYTMLPIHVLIRPRFGDFLYSQYEFEIIRGETAMFRDAGAEGVVIGCLTAEGNLDEKKISHLIEERGKMKVTLHRAFDVSRDPYLVLSRARDLGIHSILTSGQRQSCLDGMDLLQSLKERCDGIEILVGSGVNASAIEVILKNTRCRAFHMSGKAVLKSGMKYRNQDVSMGISSMGEFEIWRTDKEEIEAAAKVLRGWKD